MDEHVRNAGMDGPLALKARHPVLHDGHDLSRAGFGLHLAGRQVPELPRRAGNRCLNVQRCHVGIVRLGLARLTHCIGIVKLPSGERGSVALVGGLVAQRQSFDETLSAEEQ